MNDNNNPISARYCTNCDRRFDEVDINRCPNCNSDLFPVRDIKISDLAVGSEFLDLKCKNVNYPSKKKLRKHAQAGDRRGADNRLVEVRRVIDKGLNEYEEKIIDLETGATIRDCKEPLSKHRGRGSERIKKD